MVMKVNKQSVRAFVYFLINCRFLFSEFLWCTYVIIVKIYFFASTALKKVYIKDEYIGCCTIWKFQRVLADKHRKKPVSSLLLFQLK